MILKVAICDDDINSINQIYDILLSYEMSHDIDFEIKKYTNSLDLLQEYSHKNKFHIMFIDVEMPKLNGLELAEKIRRIPDNDVKIVFVSDYPEYMQDSFNVNAFNYIPKPFDKDKCTQIIKQVTDYYKRNNTTKLFVTTDLAEEFINLKDIIRIETANAKKRILRITTSHKSVECSGTISEMDCLLNPYSFIVPSRGNLVNLERIHFLKHNSVIMDNGDEVDLSRRKYESLKERINRNLVFSNNITKSGVLLWFSSCFHMY